MNAQKPKYDAWHPGLSSDIPNRLLPLVTLFRPENSSIGYADAKEAAEFCGLEPADMTALRLERLIVHEVLIRVTADLSVPDGPTYEVLGINLRGMAAKIIDNHVHKIMGDLANQFDGLSTRAENAIHQKLDQDVFHISTGEAETPKGLWARFFAQSSPDVIQTEPAEVAALTVWQNNLSDSQDKFDQAICRALIMVVGGIVGRHGRLMADKALVTKFALKIFLNSYGSDYIGEKLEPIIAKAAKAEGYRFLPTQQKPFFMNVKGASAAGKSTIRPQQRTLAQKLNIPWEDFALISPDYWRKFLLEYESLGEDFKYAAMLTGQELEIIDKKLDRYMEVKAARKSMPHLLIDRFRFDSFDSSKEAGKNSRLLTRFGDTVYMFFIVTPPAATVERAWSRGLDTGRYKAVDDLLYHNIEAYTGMPNLFFSGVLAPDKNIHFEFLDNSVPYGQRPRTIAYGWNGEMTILNLKALNDIDRFKNVDINAVHPDEVLIRTDDTFLFLKDCLRRIPSITLANPDTGQIYGRAAEGAWIFKDTSGLPEKRDEFVDECLSVLGWDRFADGMSNPQFLDGDADQVHTLGQWTNTTS